jgi:sialate O-acetylesterase
MAQADDLWVPRIFSEKMVLQRQMPIPVWGKAAKGAAVTVKLAKDNDLTQILATGTTTADDGTGRWRLDLPAVEAQTNCGLLIEAESPDKKVERRAFYDVMVGEVWITCGQSNCIMPIEDCDDYEDALQRRGEYPLLRAIGIGMRGTKNNTAAQEDCYGFWGPATWLDQSWQITKSSKKDLCGGSQGLSYFFSRALQDALGKDLPIGMVNVGAILPVETWVGPEEVEVRPELHHLKDQGYPHATSRGYLSNIAPLAPFAVRGVIYYQGEMNSGRSKDTYHGLKGLIASWRRAWGRADLPFYIVQLPGFIEHRKQKQHALDMDAKSVAEAGGKNEQHSWPHAREAQLRVAAEDSKVELIVTIDLGDKFDLHPRRKLPVAERLALKARKHIYGEEPLVADAPIPTTYQEEKGGFRVTFDGVGKGLVARGALAGFELQTKDGEWHAAHAVIDGNQVVVTGATGQTHTGVRYGWRGFPEVTLTNSAGLPATPFIHPRMKLQNSKL